MYTLLDAGKNPMYVFGQELLNAFWRPEEVRFDNDGVAFRKLNRPEQDAIKMIMAFFAGADGLVMRNVKKNIDLDDMGAAYFASIQAANEAVHADMYTRLLMILVPDPNEQDFLFRALENVPSIKAKKDYVEKYMSADLETRLIATVNMEMLGFASSFPLIDVICRENGDMTGVITGNNFVIRDESQHGRAWACYLCKLGITDKDRARDMTREMVELEIDFMKDVIPNAVWGANADDVIIHVKYVANMVCRMMNVDFLYPGINSTPFESMEKNGLFGRSSVHEGPVTDYASAPLSTKSFADVDDF